MNKSTIMKKIVLMLLVFGGIMLDGNAALKVKVSNELITAICKVESELNSAAIGDGGKAIGMAQIHKCCIDDVNRILGYKCYSYEDRKSPSKSKQIMRVYLSYYGAQYTKSTGKQPTTDILSRIWNGGPKGYLKQATLAYAKKVKKYLMA